ncbi:type IV toxin-antitoxin system AbiEi family antitoxin domain-containing protein, partial [Arthrobacter sp. YD2]|uniref:type IV toxin-antitoxin system AbiEi family antitoxin domain-containing protein n=1 Tax=Arthrobacter sp. YD2 TaxID=3058046 RepID=UPI0025B49493
MSKDVLATVSELAAAQWGLLTTSQAAAHGVTRMQLVRLVGAGLLDRVDQGIYSMASSTTDNFRSLHASWLSLDPGNTVEQRITRSREAIVASHTSAAALHSMGDLLHDVPEITTRQRKQTVRAIRLHRLSLSADDVVLVDALPTTTPERTIADLVRSGHDLTHIADAVRDGHRSGILDFSKLREKLAHVANRTPYGAGDELLERILDLAGLSTAALTAATVKSSVGQLIASTSFNSGVMEAIKYMTESASLANLPTPMLNSGVMEAIKNMTESASLANLPTPMLNSGVMEAIKNMTESASLANLPTPML